MIHKILNSETKSISAASLILAVSYITSACLGLMRDRLLAGIFGAGNELDVYYTAFTVPDFIALLLIFGAISAAVIPIFSSYLVKSRDEAFAYLSTFLNVFLGFLIIVCIILILTTPLIISLIAPGFSPEKKEMTATLMRIMFLSPIILGASNIVSGILHIFNRFLVTALSPLLYNLGIIIGIVAFVPRWGITGLAWGVVLGGVLHLIVQIPALFLSGFKYKISFNIFAPGIIKTLKLMVPRSLGLAAGQINTIAITAIASTLAAGSIAVFNLANNLSSMMVSAMAISISTAMFPSLAMDFISDREKFQRKFSRVLRQLLFLTVPVTFLLLLLRAQVVRVVLGAGKFDWVDTKLTTACLGILAFNVIAQGMILFFSKSFYAAHNTRVPAILSGVTVAFNIILSMAFVWLIKGSPAFSAFIQSMLRLSGVNNIGVIGLALAFTITALAEAILLWYYFAKHFPTLDWEGVSESFYKISLSTLIMVGATFVVRQLLGLILPLEIFWGIFFQLIISGAAGIVVYLAASHRLKSAELTVLIDSFLKKVIVVK